MKAITGQYECIHSSGVGMDYFTSRIDKLALYPNSRFLLLVQKQSRAVHAARSFLKNQQGVATETEMRLEGSYTQRGDQLEMQFENGGFEKAVLSQDGSGVQIGPNFFTKVSDSTLLPPAHRMKQDMDDIAKGLKIASTLGGFAMKTAKTIRGTVQAVQGTTSAPVSTNGSVGSQGNTPPMQGQPVPGTSSVPVPTAGAAGSQGSPLPVHAVVSDVAARSQIPNFCDQCGAHSRPGKKFCGNCGAPLSG